MASRHDQLAVFLVVLVVALAFIAHPGSPQPLGVTPTLTILEPLPHELVVKAIKGPTATPTLELRATGYNSHVAQTDTSPFITATGTRTRPGVVAVSRDLLVNDLPYGSLVRLRDLGTYHGRYSPGYFQPLLDTQGLFIVEDTMHARKTQQIDIWFGDLESAVRWGVRKLEVQVVRYGYDGPMLDAVLTESEFESAPLLLASNPIR